MVFFFWMLKDMRLKVNLFMLWKSLFFIVFLICLKIICMDFNYIEESYIGLCFEMNEM